jgi:hypothetical protein
MSSSRALQLAGLLLALPVLNAMFVFTNQWPGIGIRLQGQVSVELALLVLGLGLWLRRGGRLAPRVRSALAALLGLAVLIRYADVTSRALLGRPVNLYWDGQHAWQVLRMAGAEEAWGRLAATLLGGLLALALFYLLLQTLLGALLRALAHPPTASAVCVLALLTLTGAALAPRLGPPVQQFVADPVSGTVLQQARAMARSMSPEAVERRLPASPAFDSDLSVLGGADVVVLFLEAYGVITLDEPRIAGELGPSREALAHAIAKSGRGAVSARVVSPTFGGASWLAHAALMSGLDTRDPDTYAALLRSRRPTLVSHFAGRGYRTVAWVPGIQRPWPEGRFWGFDRYGELEDIGYRGLPFGYWQIPDQVAMALLEHSELSPEARRSTPGPRFVMYPIVSTHAPFVPVAPFKPDWAALRGAEAFTAAERDAALAAPEDWTQPVPQYIGAFRYTFAWLASFIAERADPDLLLVVIGDHQPIGAVTGPGAPWDVPVHVIGRNSALLARLRLAGFVDGIDPAAGAIGPMHALTPVLLQAFGDTMRPAAPAAAPP